MRCALHSMRNMPNRARRRICFCCSTHAQSYALCVALVSQRPSTQLEAARRCRAAAAVSARVANPDAALAMGALGAEAACAVELELAAALAGLATSGPCSASAAGHSGGDAGGRAVDIARCLQVQSRLSYVKVIRRLQAQRLCAR